MTPNSRKIPIKNTGNPPIDKTPISNNTDNITIGIKITGIICEMIALTACLLTSFSLLTK
jgi:hypothetical protein